MQSLLGKNTIHSHHNFVKKKKNKNIEIFRIFFQVWNEACMIYSKTVLIY